MKRGIGILLTCVMLLSGCTGKQGAQAERTKKKME